MTICPDCGFENIEGADACERCQSSLWALSRPKPASTLERRIMKDKVSALVPREPLVVAPEVPVGEVLRRLVERSMGCAVVIAKHEVVGIFTDRDAVLKLDVEAPQWARRPVRQFMTRSVETVDLDDRIAFALHKMDIGGYRHLPILNQGRITGIISVRDILNHITAAL